MKKRPTGFLRAMPDRRVTDDGARVRVSRVAWINLVTHTHHQLDQQNSIDHFTDAFAQSIDENPRSKNFDR
jgi:hypothetical protein